MALCEFVRSTVERREMEMVIHINVAKKIVVVCNKQGFYCSVLERKFAGQKLVDRNFYFIEKMNSLQ